ncbi:MAG: hypothetical protein ACFB4I_23970 [Cyanophyceae cyanobacterium]
MNHSSNAEISEKLNQSSPQASQVEQPADTPPLNHHPGVLFVPFGFVAVAWVLVFVSRIGLWKTGGSQTISPKQCRQSPCLNCRFFRNNPYLKCAVHPSKVLSAEAKDCPDYWSHDSDKFSQ